MEDLFSGRHLEPEESEELERLKIENKELRQILLEANNALARYGEEWAHGSIRDKLEILLYKRKDDIKLSR